LKELNKKAGAEKKLMQILNLHQLFFQLYKNIFRKEK